MKNLVLCITLNILFFISIVYSVQVIPQNTLVRFQPKAPIKLSCNVTYEGDQPRIEWFKGSKEVSKIDDLSSRTKTSWDKNVNVLTIEPSHDNDAGNYSCVTHQDSKELRADIIAERTIAVKVPSYLNVVEENRLRIECKVLGNPVLYWKWKNETYRSSRDRVTLEDYTDDDRVIRNGVFIVEKVTEDDRGIVQCYGEDLYTNETVFNDCMVIVKDKYAALWPFLGICAEVIILCAIIVIYEKKRNKTELEESDTDQSPDQKNTPDHGKEANLRHRQ